MSTKERRLDLKETEGSEPQPWDKRGERKSVRSQTVF